MKIAFQADNDFDQTIVRILWQAEPTIAFRTAAEVNLHRLDDPPVLFSAVLEKRILVSSDQTNDAPSLCRIHSNRNKLRFANRAAKFEY
jgi:hypothetical protein